MIDFNRAQHVYLVDPKTFREYEKSLAPQVRYSDVWLEQHGIENLLADRTLSPDLVHINGVIIACKKEAQA